MNLDQLRKLKDKDIIVCEFQPFPFTPGKEYTVKKTPIGRVIIDDNGIGKFLNNEYAMFELFDKKESE